MLYEGITQQLLQTGALTGQFLLQLLLPSPGCRKLTGQSFAATGQLLAQTLQTLAVDPAVLFV